MNDVIHHILLGLLPVTAFATIFMKNLINAAIVYSVLCLLVALVIFQLKAPDVALSLLLVNAVAVAIFLFAVQKTEVEE
jgi:energy-converting hydrogenase B subunit D